MHLRRAAEDSQAQVVSIGDKGRSQLMRTEGKLFTLCVADTYKIRVTFGQVGTDRAEGEISDQRGADPLRCVMFPCMFGCM